MRMTDVFINGALFGWSLGNQFVRYTQIFPDDGDWFVAVRCFYETNGLPLEFAERRGIKNASLCLGPTH